MTGETVVERDGLPRPRRTLAAVSIGMGIAMAVLDAAVVNVALPSIAAATQSDPATTVWVINAYQLAIVATLLPLAAVGGRFGFRTTYVAGLVLFGAGSAACAFSPSLVLLIWSRALQGLGAAAIMSANGALIRFTYPKAIIGWGVGVNALVVSMSAAAGPSIAALILSLADWRWLFLVNLPFVLVNVVLAARTLPEEGSGNRALDWSSAILTVITFSTIFLGFALSTGTRHRPLELSISLGMAGLVTGLALVRRELKATKPIIPFDLLRDRAFGLACLASTIAFVAYMAAFVTLPFLLSGLPGSPPARIGLLMTPWPVALGVAAVVSGKLSDRLPPALLSATGIVLMALGLVCIAWLPPSPSDFDIVWRFAIAGFGFGFFQAPNNRALLSSVPKPKAGAAGGAMAMSRMIGMTTGAAIAAPFLQQPKFITYPLWGAAGLALLAGILCLVRARPPAKTTSPST